MTYCAKLLLGIATAAPLMLPVLARADCVAPGYNTSGSFCDGCRYEGTMTLSHDQICERPNMPGQGGGQSINMLQFLSERITQRARHGVAGASGNTMAYAPAKGYVGKDEFTVEVVFRQGQQGGKYYVHWNVTVQ